MYFYILIIMITAEIMGGLGNQMCIIFTLITHSINKKTPFYIEDKNISVGNRTITYWSNLFTNLSTFIKPVKEINAIIREKNCNYNKLPKLKKETTYKLMGYFQSYKYFNDRKDDILKLLKWSSITEPYSNLYDFNNSISLHFRLGDYKRLQGYHPVLSLDYYEKCFEYLLSVTESNNWQVLYFCEDEDFEYISTQIDILQEKFPMLSFLRANETLEDWEQLIIMSCCKHNIMANSTFSWWASYLNNNEDKQVCCPSVIMGPKTQQPLLEDRYLPTWKIIDASFVEIKREEKGEKEETH